jgi:hypothetical protein
VAPTEVGHHVKPTRLNHKDGLVVLRLSRVDNVSLARDKDAAKLSWSDEPYTQRRNNETPYTTRQSSALKRRPQKKRATNWNEARTMSDKGRQEKTSHNGEHNN